MQSYFTSGRTLKTTLVKNVISAVCAISALAILPASGANADNVAVSSPTIKIALEPYTPDGKMRLYTVAGGASYWTQDMPIYSGDTAKLDVFVATGADELQMLKVRVDNQLIATINNAPWSTSLSTATLTPGYHFIETWAQVTTNNPKKPQFATDNFTFLVSPATADLSLPTTVSTSQIAPIAQVKGQEQILNNGQITTVPLDNGTSNSSAPSIPATLQSASIDNRATVNIVVIDQVSHASLTLDSYGDIDISQASVASIVAPHGSTAINFVYTITRGDETIESADKMFPIDATRIGLRPRTQDQQGLLNGIATLWVWGIDPKGNYGQPVSAAINIQNAFGG